MGLKLKEIEKKFRSKGRIPKSRLPYEFAALVCKARKRENEIIKRMKSI